MTPERELLSRLGWLAGGAPLPLDMVRPPSLGSEMALRTMGITVHLCVTPLPPEQAMGEMAVYLWLHRCPLPEINAAFRDGTWRDLLESMSAVPPIQLMLEAFQAHLEWVRMMNEAADVRVVPRPQLGGHDPATPPADWVGPLPQVILASRVAGQLREPFESVLWERPSWQVRQLHHAWLFDRGDWTVPASSTGTGQVTGADFVGFDLPTE